MQIHITMKHTTTKTAIFDFKHFLMATIILKYAKHHKIAYVYSDNIVV